MVAPLQCELGLWGLLTLLSLGEAQARSVGHAAVLSRPQARLLCGVQSRARLTVLLLCSGSPGALPAGAPDEDTRRPEGRRNLHLPSTRCPSSSPAPLSNSAVKNKPSPGGPVAWLLSELAASASPHHFGAPGVPEQPPVRSTRAVLSTGRAAGSCFSHLLPLCSLVSFLALQWLFNQLSTFKISQFT